MSLLKTDGTFTSATAITNLTAYFPIQRDTTAIVYSQDFMILRSNYSAPTLDAANATYGSAYLIGDNGFQDLKGGLIKFTRQWATIPATRSDYGTFAYRFIGLLGNGNPPYSALWDNTSEDGRDPETKRVTSRLLNEYFFCTTGQTYTTPGAIPRVAALLYALDSNPNARLDYLLKAGSHWSESVPTREAYETLISGGTEIVAEESELQNYMGNIWCRITRYVVAL